MPQSQAQIIDRGTVFQGQRGSSESSAAFPSVAVLPGGRWLVSFRAAPVKGNPSHDQRPLLTWSDDEGRSWSKAVAPFTPCSVDGKPGTWRGCYATPLGANEVVGLLVWVDASDPSLPFFNQETEGLLDTRIYLARSSNQGETWSSTEPVDVSPYDCPVPLTGPLLVRPDGTWILHFETNKHYTDASVWHHQSVLMFSGDQGGHWRDPIAVAADPEARVFYWDQRPSVLADGSIFDLFWTFDREAAVYRNIHARESRDGGRRWSEIWDTGVPGQPAPAVMLTDERLAMVFVDREGPPAIKLITSADRGRSWDRGGEIVLSDSSVTNQTTNKQSMKDAWTEMSAFSLGLPHTALLPNDELLVVYYAGPETDHTGIHWARCGWG